MAAVLRASGVFRQLGIAARVRRGTRRLQGAIYRGRGSWEGVLGSEAEAERRWTLPSESGGRLGVTPDGRAPCVGGTARVQGGWV